MRRRGIWLTVIGAATLSALTAAIPARGAAAAAVPPAAPPVVSSSGVEYFEKRVRPILAKACYDCHSVNANQVKAGFTLDTKAGLLRGGESGKPAVIPGDVKDSPLLRAVSRADKSLKPMPPKGRLSDDQIAVLAQWVRMGAPMPADPAPIGGAKPLPPDTDYSAKYDKLRHDHWAYQPIVDTQPPKTTTPNWAKTDVDAYLLAKLEAAGLKPSPQADRMTLIRRATFDLTGLPPTPEEVSAFVNDPSPKAWEKVIDRLLASPAFGERWGRHWLDLARYAESTGMSRNVPLYYAWRYRDWVIDAVNADKPYDRFCTEQLAGDLLPAKTNTQRDAQLIATGFLAIGPKDLNERNPQQFLMNNVDEQIDVFSRSMLGLTVSCARCHDHKFDPIPQADYYSIAGIFRSTEILAGVGSRKGNIAKGFYDEDAFLPLTGPANDGTSHGSGKVAAANNDDADLRAMRLAALEATKGISDPQKRREAIQQEMQKKRQMQIRKVALEGGERSIRPVTLGVEDAARVADANVLVRGEVDQRGPVVKRGFLSLVSIPETAATAIPSNHSGRLELAAWVTSRQNPLTSRVEVNRIWQHLFGQGLVPTPDNFGASGEPPTHPELLDHLATQFMNDGWSVKRMIKRLMLSSAYQQSSQFDAKKHDADPDDKLLWRMPQRRLEAEAIRDAMLAAAGQLERGRPTGSPVIGMPPVEIGRRRVFENQFASVEHARSVYLPIFRNFVPDELEVFDEADPNLVTAQREVTTVSSQALFMMNSPFVVEQAKALAARVLAERQGSEAARVDRAYQLALGRSATSAERDRTMKFLKEVISTARDGKGATPQEAWSVFCQALMQSAEFRYVN